LFCFFESDSKKDTWVKGTIGQHLLTSGQISWTAECTRQLSELHKNKKAMRTLYARWNQYLERLATYIRGNLNPVDRLKLVALITIEVSLHFGHFPLEISVSLGLKCFCVSVACS
jgi:hypothetical protein